MTSRPLDVEWAGTQVVDGGLVDFVRALREQPGGDIGVPAPAAGCWTAARPGGWRRSAA